MPQPWPLNRNHEAARRHTDQILRDHARPTYGREREIATLLDELIRERDELRERVYGQRQHHAHPVGMVADENCPACRHLFEDSHAR